MQWNNGLNYLVKKLKKSGYFVELESNATLPLEDAYKEFNILNLSPKLKSAGYGIEYYDKIGMIKFWKKYTNKYNNYTFKFVISDKKDIEEVNNWVNHLYLDKWKVYLMASSIDIVSHQKNSEMIIELVKKYNYLYSPRLQIVIWDKTVGV